MLSVLYFPPASTISSAVISPKLFVTTSAVLHSNVGVGVSANNLVYGAYGRIVKDNNPMLTCAVDSDRFTVNKINGKGNSALTYPIGLITIDELEMAGNNWSESNTSYYLHTGANYWAGSPDVFSNSNSGVFVLHPFFGLRYGSVNNRDSAARGVVSLSSESKLLGSGTYNDVYRVN